MQDWLHPGTLVFLLVKLVKVVGVPVIGGGGGWLGRKWLLSRSTHWPITHGSVQGIYPGHDKAMCLLSYSYTVNGEYYSGELPVFKGRIFCNIEAVHLALPVGSSIDLRYSPSQPHSSVGIIPEMILNGGFVSGLTS